MAFDSFTAAGNSPLGRPLQPVACHSAESAGSWAAATNKWLAVGAALRYIANLLAPTVRDPQARWSNAVDRRKYGRRASHLQT
jgi:hypothetical protein